MKVRVKEKVENVSIFVLLITNGDLRSAGRGKTRENGVKW